MIEPETEEAVRAPVAPGKPRRSHLAIALVTALLGFLLATQFQSREELSTRLVGEREEDLAQLLSNLATSGDQIQDEIIDLRVRLQAAQGSAEQEKVLLDNARSQLNSLRMLLGLVPVHGEGVLITIGDSSSAVGPDLVLDLIQELRDAGAEAIDINGLRVVASTSITGEPGSVSVGGSTTQSPFQISAIGSAETMAEALKIPGGVVDSVNARQGTTIVIQKRADIKIASLRLTPRFTYATPA